MQLVFGILICCLLGLIVVCGILLIIVQWMRLHNEKKAASGHRLSIPLSRLHMQQNISRHTIQKEEETRFGMPVNLKKPGNNSSEKPADKRDEETGEDDGEKSTEKFSVKTVDQLSDRLKESLLQSIEACYEVASEPVEVVSAEAKDNTESIKAASGQAEAEDLLAEEEPKEQDPENNCPEEDDNPVMIQAAEQKKLVLRKPFLELTKEMAIHEEELPVSMQRLIPAMEKLALGKVGKYGPSDKFSGNENEKASYYLEVIGKKLS